MKKFSAARVVRPWHKLLHPKNVPGWVGEVLEQPGLVKGVPAHGRGLEWNEL